MSIEKCKDFEKDGYGTWDDSSKPTTYANMHDYMKNQNNVTLALANGLWQPSTAYSVGAVIHSPSLPAGCKATCTTAGTTGSTEPKWTAYGTTVSDGTVKWKVETDVQGTMDGERKKALDDMHTTITGEITNAINNLHNTIKTEMQTAMLALFPVGTILETTNSANPSTYIGGTWEQLDAGLTTITAGTYKETHNGTEDTYVFTAGSSNFTRNGTSMTGEAEHVITEGELTNHGHLVRTWNTVNSGAAKVYITSWKPYEGTEYFHPDGTWSSNNNNAPQTGMGDPAGTTDGTGGNQPHNNLPPIYGVYKFRRVS